MKSQFIPAVARLDKGRWGQVDHWCLADHLDPRRASRVDVYRSLAGIARDWAVEFGERHVDALGTYVLVFGLDEGTGAAARTPLSLCS